MSIHAVLRFVTVWLVAFFGFLGFFGYFFALLDQMVVEALNLPPEGISSDLAMGVAAACAIAMASLTALLVELRMRMG